MSLTDKPLPMNQICVAMVQDLGKVYENNAAHEKGDLNTVWESMYSIGLHRKVSSQCFTPEEIEEARRTEEKEKEKREEEEKEKEKERKDQEDNENQEQEDDNNEVFVDDGVVEEERRDFASVHMNRAINSGRAHMHDEGRRYRKRTYTH